MQPGQANGILSASDARGVSTEIQRLLDNVRSLIYIDPRTLEFLIAAKIAGGHVILADSHGVGKTSLARALAQSIQWQGPRRGGVDGSDGEVAHVDLSVADVSVENVPISSFSRIQCTVDLLPQDILGFSRYELSTSSLIFNRGPIFAHFVLCDEINLLTPKTQGSFFQAMEEQAISIEGNTYHLPDPFFIIATMNLKGAHLFPLPVPQLDRFMVQLSLGYPSDDDEERIVHQHGRDDSWSGFAPVVAQERLNQWQGLVDSITIHDEVVSYLVTLVRQTRGHPAIETGASPRTGVKGVAAGARAGAGARRQLGFGRPDQGDLRAGGGAPDDHAGSRDPGRRGAAGDTGHGAGRWPAAGAAGRAGERAGGAGGRHGRLVGV